jgi:hypothetical protein
MEELLRSVWVQAGAMGILTISGWLMWWLERKERLEILRHRLELSEKFLNFMHEQKDVIEKLTEGLNVERLLRDKLESSGTRNVKRSN